MSGDEPVTLVAVEAYGSAVANVTYRRAGGTVGERLVLQSELPSLRLAAAGRPFTFDADPELFKLVAEARRLIPYRGWLVKGVGGGALVRPGPPRVKGAARPCGTGCAGP